MKLFYLGKCQKLLLAVFLTTMFAASGFAQYSKKLKKEAIETAGALTDQIDAMSKELWEFSETALKESKSAALLIQHLEEAGFTVEKGVADMPTAFVATYGGGSPMIGVLAEYDALPGVGNEPVPERRARTDGVTSGHGCGHNLFGAGSVGGAIALKQLMEKRNISGTIKLFGTPAEETVVGKVYMAKAGVFDGLDAVIDWHPGTETAVRNRAGQAMNNFEIEFFGQAAHSAADPWNGRSALDAVEMMNYGVNLMREHVKPTTRIHYVIPSAGEAPNVVPEYAKVWYYVRDVNRTEVEMYYDRILNIAKGSALATGTTHEVFLITGVHEYLLIRPLQEAMQENLELVGAPSFTEEEQVFAKELQRFCEKEEKGFNAEIKPLAEGAEPPSGGSTDAAEVSYMTPIVAFSVATAAEGVPWHSWATSSCHGTAAGRKGAVVAAKVIAATGVDMLTRPKLMQAAKDAFMEATKGKPYKSPLPKQQKPPLPTSE